MRSCSRSKSFSVFVVVDEEVAVEVADRESRMGWGTGFLKNSFTCTLNDVDDDIDVVVELLLGDGAVKAAAVRNAIKVGNNKAAIRDRVFIAM